MISQKFAQNFISKIERSLDLKVNVFNEKGIIIASSSPERIGSFHRGAYEMLQNNMPVHVIEKTSPDLIGTLPGVNYLLRCGNETIGALGVSGNSPEIILAAKTMKLTFEVMYEYEQQKQQEHSNRHLLNRFSYILLQEYPQNLYSITKTAKNYGYKDECPRIPIYIIFHTEQLKKHIDHFISSQKKLPDYSTQDIVLPVTHGVLLLKTAPKNAYQNFRISISQFYQEISSYTGPCCMITAPIQTRFTDYYAIFQHLSWLEHKIKSPPDTLHFLMDHSTELLMQQIPTEQLLPLFEYYCQEIKENLNDEIFRETVGGLISCNMHLEQTAKELHLHKNSINARLSKIKNLLNINPLGNIRDAVLLVQIYDYYINKF